MGPGLKLLERRGRPQHRGVLEPAPHDLEPHRQLVAGDAARHRGPRVPGHVEREGEGDPVIRLHGRPRDLRGVVEPDLEGRARDGRGSGADRISRRAGADARSRPGDRTTPGRTGSAPT